MKLLNLIKTHWTSVVSLVLVALAAAFGADCAFAMAVDPVEVAAAPNPSGNMNPYDAASNPEGRPDGEALQNDELGGKTQLQGHAATATDVRDAGFEAEDYDPTVVNFRKFKFPSETYIANLCRPVKSKSYEHGHFRTASTVLEATYNGAEISIDKSYTVEKALTIKASDFVNPECLTVFSVISIEGATGYQRDASGNEAAVGDLQLYVTARDNTNISFVVLNAPIAAGTTSTIASGTVFYALATAGSETQVLVEPETFLPEKKMSYLQKKIVTFVVSKELEEQAKKTKFGMTDIKANALYNFKRKCARTHWIGSMGKLQVNVPGIGREDVYTEQGIIPQVPMLYTYDELSFDDLSAISALEFTENGVSDSAIAFCGKGAIINLMKLINATTTQYKDVCKVEVDEFGIRVRKWRDNFGEIKFVYDPTLDDIGYKDYMVVVDLKNAVRYYMVNDKSSVIDMAKSRDARDANAYSQCTIDCVALRGYNAVLVCPNSVAAKATQLGGIQATFVTVDTLPASPDAAAKLKKYYLSAESNGFAKGTIVEWDAEAGDWKEFEGIVRG